MVVIQGYGAEALVVARLVDDLDRSIVPLGHTDAHRYWTLPSRQWANTDLRVLSRATFCELVSAGPSSSMLRGRAEGEPRRTRSRGQVRRGGEDAGRSRGGRPSACPRFGRPRPRMCDDLAVLGVRSDPELHRSGRGGHRHLAAEEGLGQGERISVDQVGAVPREARIGLDLHASALTPWSRSRILAPSATPAGISTWSRRLSTRHGPLGALRDLGQGHLDGAVRFRCAGRAGWGLEAAQVAEVEDPNGQMRRRRRRPRRRPSVHHYRRRRGRNRRSRPGPRRPPSGRVPAHPARRAAERGPVIAPGRGRSRPADTPASCCPELVVALPLLGSERTACASFTSLKRRSASASPGLDRGGCSRARRRNAFLISAGVADLGTPRTS